MQPSLLDRLKIALESLSRETWVVIGCALLALVLALILWQILHRRKPRRLAPEPDLTIDVAALGQHGPPTTGPVLELYNVPMRLATVILAPAGRVRQLPPAGQLPAVFEAILPGLDRIVQAQQPLIRRWPGQLSGSGFANVVFANVRLPGDGGKGTPWSAVAGMFKMQGQPLMAGLVLRAAQPNSIGQTVIESEPMWLGCLRVKERE
jgi:hypothetical protein